MNEENKNQIILIDNFCENVDMSFNAIVLGEKGKK
jgi:hypothetical protein